MRREDILAMTRARPFQPFVVLLTSGERFEIRHPDMIVPTLGMATIGVPAPGAVADAADRVIHVSLVHIVKVEPLYPPSSTSSNGVAG